MNKTQMVDEIINEHPDDLILEVLWEDKVWRDKIKSKLLGISEENLHPYHDHFVGQPITVVPKIAEHKALYPSANSTLEYIRQNR